MTPLSTDVRRAYVVALLDRLRRQYADRALLPSAAHDVDDTEERETLSLQRLQRLYRCIISEFSEV